jgi:hypothetical protein
MQLNLIGEKDKSKSMATENNHQPSNFQLRPFQFQKKTLVKHESKRQSST